MSLSRPKRRARLSMTSLIDVIFLLLLFFMLSSTFSKFAEIELRVGGSGSGSDAAVLAQTLFLRLSEEEMTLNGQPIETENLIATLQQNRDAPSALIVSVTQTAKAQVLADVLVAVRAFPELRLSVIGPN
ncbi:MAG: biopolymer transporter ExbD [Pseudomonadota bacterium]